MNIKGGIMKNRRKPCRMDSFLNLLVMKFSSDKIILTSDELLAIIDDVVTKIDKEPKIELSNMLRSILELGRKDLSNPKYDDYFIEAIRILERNK